MTNERPFLFCTGIGFDASVIRRVERHSRRLKRLASHPLHIAAAVHTFFSADGRARRASTSTSKTRPAPSRRSPTSASGSSRRPSVHAPRPPAAPRQSQRGPRNPPVDHRVHAAAGVVAHRRRRVVDPERQVPPQSQRRRAARRHRGSCTCSSENPFPYQVDGDDVGDTTELHIALETDALTVALPPPTPHPEHS